MSKFLLQTQIYFEDEVDGLISSFHNERILFVCDQFLVENPSVNSFIDMLKKKNDVQLFTDIVPDPPLEKITSGVAMAIQFQPAIMFAVGGGSAIDTAKAIRYFAEQADKLQLDAFVAIPSTSGTGSEVTAVSVVTDTENKSKYPIVDERIIPDFALLIPSLVTSCPKSVTAFSGMDVLTHALEALVAKDSNSFTDSLAEKAIELTFEYLPACYANGSNKEYRKLMHEASCLAGIAFQNAGLGIVHAISHQIGGLYHVPHGLSNTILLPSIVRFNSGDLKVRSKYANMARRLKFAATQSSDEEAKGALITAIQELGKAIGCADSFSSVGLDKKEVALQIPTIIKNAEQDFTFAGNPVTPSKEDMLNILLSVL